MRKEPLRAALYGRRCTCAHMHARAHFTCKFAHARPTLSFSFAFYSCVVSFLFFLSLFFSPFLSLLHPSPSHRTAQSILNYHWGRFSHPHAISLLSCWNRRVCSARNLGHVLRLLWYLKDIVAAGLTPPLPASLALAQPLPLPIALKEVLEVQGGPFPER